MYLKMTLNFLSCGLSLLLAEVTGVCSYCAAGDGGEGVRVSKELLLQP